MNKPKQVIPYFNAFEFDMAMKEHSFYLTPKRILPHVTWKVDSDNNNNSKFLTYRYDPKTGKYTRSDNKKVI